MTQLLRSPRACPVRLVQHRVPQYDLDMPDGDMPGGHMPEGEQTPIVAVAPRPGRLRRILRITARAIGLFLLISVLWTALYTWLPVPITPLMVIRLVEGYGFSKDWVSYDEISPNLPRAAIASEDSGFCAHHG